MSIPAGSHTVYVKCVHASSTPDTTDGDCTSQRSAFIDWISFSANDADGDGVADASDNCPNAANAPQADLDGDGQGDACDADIDGDGRPNDTDYAPDDPSVQDAPPAPSGTILWSGDGENPTNQDWSRIFTKAPYCGATPQGGIAPNNHGGYHTRVTSNPTPLQGSYAYKEVVDDSIDCWQERTELSQKEDARQFHPGDENWEAFGVWLGPDFDINRDMKGASTTFQHKPVPSNNPTTSIKIANGDWYWVTQGGTATNTHQTKDVIAPATRGVWYRFVLHTKYTSSEDGLTELYSDAPGGPGGPIELVGSRTKPTLWETSSGSSSIRVNMGFYRESGDNGTETLAHDGYTVGTTREIVERSAF